jgi:hypothetical protein
MTLLANLGTLKTHREIQLKTKYVPYESLQLCSEYFLPESTQPVTIQIMHCIAYRKSSSSPLSDFNQN